MKTASFALLVVLAVLFALPPAQADSPSPAEDFYRGCINQKIVQCGQKVRFIDAEATNVRYEGERALDQLVFYHNRKEELIREMVRLNLGSNPHRVECFLIRAYRTGTIPDDLATPEGVESARSQITVTPVPR